MAGAINIHALTSPTGMKCGSNPVDSYAMEAYTLLSPKDTDQDGLLSQVESGLSLDKFEQATVLVNRFSVLKEEQKNCQISASDLSGAATQNLQALQSLFAKSCNAVELSVSEDAKKILAGSHWKLEGSKLTNLTKPTDVMDLAGGDYGDFNRSVKIGTLPKVEKMIKFEVEECSGRILVYQLDLTNDNFYEVQ